MKTFTLLFTFLVCQQAFATTDRYRLMFNNDPSSTITVAWEQVSGSNSEVFYGTADEGTNWSAYPNSMTPYKTTNYMGMTNKFAVLTGLSSNTIYYFVIKDSDGTGQRYWFKTCPNVNTHKLSFISGGDSRSGQTQRQNSNRMVAKIRPHAVLFGGDLVNTPTNSSVQTWFDDWKLSYTSDGQIIPLVHSFGNHEDYGFGGPEFISELFDTPYDVYYKVTFGGDLFSVYTLNGELLPGHTIPNSTKRANQTAWLASTLPSDPAVWKSAQYHRPIVPHYSGKGEGADEFNDWANLFYDHGVRLVMESDAHVTKLTEEVKPAMSSASGNSSNWFTTSGLDPNQGITFIGEGAWGTIRTPDDSHPMTTGMTSMYQFVWITVDNCAIELRTIDTQSPGTVPEHTINDQFSISSGLDAQIWKPSGLPTGVRAIRRCYPPDADFAASVTSAFTGQSINFTDLSTNTPTSWSWDFGDGNTSTQQNPSNTYATPGTYTVTLSASNADGTGVETKTGYITIYAPTAPTADFVANQTVAAAGTTINFTDLSTGAPASWSWSFPGGTPNSSTSQNPSITYNSAGSYDVILTATNIYGNDTETKTGYINITTGGTVSVVISSGNDDAEEERTGGGAGDMYLNSSDLEIGNDGGTEQYVGLRFRNINIPQGAIITNAYLRFRADETDFATSQLNIYIAGEDIDDASTFTNAQNNISSRNFTTNQVTWPDGSVPQWNSGSMYNTPDISAVVQEIVDRSGWTNNNDMAYFLWSDLGESSERVADSYEGGFPAELIIDWIAPPAPVANFSGTPTEFCAGQTLNLNDQSTNNPSSWDWQVTGPATLSSNQQNPSFNLTAAGTYSIQLTAANSGGQNVFSQINYVTVNPLPNVSAGTNQSICDGSSITLSGSGASSYSWDNGVIDGAAFAPATTQTYTVTGTDANGCVNTDQLTVSVNPLPNVSAGNDQTVCSGTSVTLSGSGATNYSWNNGITDGVAFTPTSNQTYTVTGTDANGCSNTDQVNVNVNALPNVSAGSDQTICEGTSVTLNGSGASTYSWNNGVNNGIAFTINSSQSYTVTGTDANGCSNTDQVDITVHALPNVSGGIDQTVCAGTSITLTGSGASTYSWNNGVTNGASFVPGSSQNYTVTGTDGNGCSNTDLVAVTVNLLPNVSAGADVAVCDGNTVTLSGSGATSYSWDQGVNNGVAFTPTSSNSYTVTGTDANGCVNTDQVNVTVNTNPTVTIGGNIQYCQGQQAVLDAGAGYSNYNWSTGGSSQTINATIADNPISISVTDANGCNGTDQITITEVTSITSSSSIDICQGQSALIHGNNETTSGMYAQTYPSVLGCDSTSQVTLTVYNLPNIEGGNNVNVCAGDSIVLSASGGQNYTWDNGVSNNVYFTPTSSGTYMVTGQDANGCVNTDSVVVTVNPLPTVTLTAFDDDTLCVESGMILLPNGSPSGGSYSGTGVNGNQMDPSIAGAGSHDVTYTYTDGNNCSEEDVATIVFEICAGVEGMIFQDASIFPNPSHDFMNVSFKTNRHVKIEVFGTSGKLVHSETTTSNLIRLDVSTWPSASYTIRIQDLDTKEYHIQQVIVR